MKLIKPGYPMLITRSAIPDVLILSLAKHSDERGFFSETFRHDVLVENGIDLPWNQDNHSYSSTKGVVRGLHFQAPPYAQTKLIRVTKGAILDVAVDIRVDSPTFGQHVAVELSAENWQQMLVPAGFAHGFCTLTEETEVLYKVTGKYVPEFEGGVLWNDPALGIDWPVGAKDAIVSPRDHQWPPLASLASPFRF
jgi:dTDP-4-dehydrorhamnose 3,5-epimerase